MSKKVTHRTVHRRLEDNEKIENGDMHSSDDGASLYAVYGAIGHTVKEWREEFNSKRSYWRIESYQQLPNESTE